MESIETFLRNLGQERFKETFLDNELDLDLLKSLSEDELKETLKELHLPLGPRMKILKGVQSLKGEALDVTEQPRSSQDLTEQLKQSQEMETLAKVEHSHGSIVDTRGNQGQQETMGSHNAAYLPEVSKSTPQMHVEVPKVKALVGNFEAIVGKFGKMLTKNTEVRGSTSSPENIAREKEIRLVLLGKTGSGKSATGNTILGTKKFASTLSMSSITRICSQNSAVRFQRKIVIVDTPGIFDTEENNETIQNEIYKCVGITSPGPHAFILVLNLAARFTDEEERSVQHFVTYFGEHAYKYFIVLFTRKDDLDDHDVTLDDHLKKCPQRLQNFVKRCGGRTIAFNNKLKGKDQNEQVQKLLNMVLRNVQANGGQWYTNEMYQKAEEEIQKVEAEKLRKEMEIRQKELDRIAEEYNKKMKKEEEKMHELQKQLNELKQMKEEESQKQYLELLESQKEMQRQLEEKAKMQEEEKRKLEERFQQEMQNQVEKIRDENRTEIEQKSSWGCTIS